VIGLAKDCPKINLIIHIVVKYNDLIFKLGQLKKLDTLL